jgi:hypothetical protein
MFFFEKKNQKTFASLGALRMTKMFAVEKASQVAKVFCFFFSKKKAFLAFLLLTPRLALAWGDQGHAVVALIAQAYMKPEVLEATRAMLASDTANTLTAHDMAAASSWADRFREADPGGAKKQTAQWHFVDTELADGDQDKACFGHPAIPEGQPAYPGVAQDCVVDKISQFQKELADQAAPPAERLLALKFLLHFVADLHQPLHAADDNDRGGNTKMVTAADFKSGTLHAFWDIATVHRLGPDPTAVAEILITNITAEQQTAWSRNDASVWADEAFRLAKADAYGALPPVGADGVYHLDEAYERRATADAGLQLSKAGVRLAAVLNAALAAPEN